MMMRKAFWTLLVLWCWLEWLETNVTFVVVVR